MRSPLFSRTGIVVVVTGLFLLPSLSRSQQLPSPGNFESMLSTCATGANIDLTYDIKGSLKMIYEGQRAQGATSFKSATEFLKLFPENQRAEAYRLYTQCIEKLVGKQNSAITPKEQYTFDLLDAVGEAVANIDSKLVAVPGAWQHANYAFSMAGTLAHIESQTGKNPARPTIIEGVRMEIRSAHERLETSMNVNKLDPAPPEFLISGARKFGFDPTQITQFYADLGTIQIDADNFVKSFEPGTKHFKTGTKTEDVGRTAKLFEEVLRIDSTLAHIKALRIFDRVSQTHGSQIYNRLSKLRTLEPRRQLPLQQLAEQERDLQNARAAAAAKLSARN